MKDQLLALLREKFQGVRGDGLQQLANSLAITVQDETQAAELVSRLTAESVNSFVTDYRREVDAENAKATKTFEQNLKGKFDFVDKKNPNPNPANPEPNPNPGTDISAIIQQAISPLLNEINSLKNEKQFEKLSSVAKTKLKEKGIPESFVGSINVKDENEIDTFIQDQETRYNLFRQESIQLGNWVDKPKSGTERTSAEAEAIGRQLAEKANNANTEGKKL